jgi:hypothetical protein
MGMKIGRLPVGSSQRWRGRPRSSHARPRARTEVRSPGRSHGVGEVCSPLEMGGRESRRIWSARFVAPPSLLCSAADADAAACVRDKVERERGWGLVPREEGHVFFPGKNEGDRQGIDRGGIPGGFNRTQKKPGLNPRESDPG